MIKFTKSKFDEIIEKIEDKIKYYEIQKCSYWRNQLYLANGDALDIVIPESSVAHLLGVNTNYLASTSLFKSSSSYELIKELCDNSYRVYKAISEGIIDPNILFSNYIFEKVDSFTDNIKININDIEFVCKYDRNKAFIHNDNNYSFDYLIVKQNEMGEVYLLGLSKNDNEYVPITNQYFKNMEEAYSKLQNICIGQATTLAIGVYIASFSKAYNLAPNKKYEKLQTTKRYADDFGSIVDITGDYKWCLSQYYKSNLSGGNLTNVTADIIVDCVSNNKLITPNEFGFTSLDQINPHLLKIISVINDLLVNGNATNEKNTASSQYEKTVNELDRLRKLNAELKSVVSDLKAENSALDNENTNLKSENGTLNNSLLEINKIIQKTRI